MSCASVAAVLAERFGVSEASVEEGRATRVPLGGDLALEFRWLAEPQALCLAIPLGRVLPAHAAELLASAMSANLYLADGGHPHYALCPRQESLYLCQTLSGDPPDATAVSPALDRLIAMALAARAALRGHGLD